MKIFLSGGGNEKQSFLVDEAFVAELKNKDVVYIPIALAPEVYRFEDCLSWFTSTLAQHGFNKIKMVQELSELDCDPQKSAIYIGGGNTYKLLKSLIDSKKDIFIKYFLHNNGIVCGGSAGAIIFGKSILTASIGKNSDRNDVHLSNTDGLNLLNGASIHAHYQKEIDNELIISFYQKHKTPVICIPEDSGIIFNNIDDNFKVVGYSPVTVITNELVDININDCFKL